MFCVLTTATKDRDGLVAGYTDELRKLGANLCSGHGQQLGRMFVFDVLFQADPADINRIRTEAATKFAYATPVCVEVEVPLAYRDPSAKHYTLHNVSEDSQGIVSKLTEVLAVHGASVVDLEAKSYSGAHNAVPMFEVVMEVDVPNMVAVRNLRMEFKHLMTHFDWDLKFEPSRREGHRPLAVSASYPPTTGGRWTPVPPPAAADTAEPPQWALLSMVSDDRPGIIASGTRLLNQRKASVHSQTARRLGSQFSSHSLFRASKANMDRIKQDFRHELAAFRPTLIDAAPPSPPRDELVADLTVQAIDEPGILADVTRPVTAHGGSVAAVSFGQYGGAEPPHGAGWFIAEFKLLVRDTIARRHIEGELLDLERARQWEMDFREEKLTFDKADSAEES